MKYTVKSAEKSTKKVTITLDAQEWEAAQKKAYEKTKGRYSVPGFRKGKAPKSVLDKMYGKEAFYEEAINLSCNEHYPSILDKEPSIEPIDSPELGVEKIDEKGIVLTLLVPVMPEVTLGEYKGITIDKVEYNVTSKEVNAELDRLVNRNAREVAVTDRAAQMGDITIIDYSGSIDGVKFDGGTAEKQTLELGSKQFIPGFEEGVVGMNIGDEKDITVKFPEDYHAEELKGKDAVFAVKLHEIKAKELPEVTDDFIKDATGEESVAAFKKATKKKLQEANDKRAKAETENNLIQKITDASSVEIPNVLVERQIDSMVQEMEYRMMYQGLRLEDYLKYVGQTMETYRESFKKDAEKRVKAQLVIEKIIKDENIVATQEDIDEMIKEQAKNMNKEFEEYKKTMNERQLGYFENSATIEKLFKFLRENNKID